MKREENWDSPRRSTSSSSGHGSLSSSGGSESGEEVLRDLSGLAAMAAAADALVCAEKVPGGELANVQPRPISRVDSDQSSIDGLSVLATQASHHTLSTHGTPTKNFSVDSVRNHSDKSPSTPHDLSQTPSPLQPPTNGYDTEDSLFSERKSLDKSPNGNETMRPSEITGRGKRTSPVGKRRYCDNVEEYEMRKVVRRKELNFRIDFSEFTRVHLHIITTLHALC